MQRIFNHINQTHFDIIIIGGGITGNSLAYEASTRGLKVALFEKDDFGQATSAATSKLIHGGLRYLKNLEFGLVRESLIERKTWENIAPNLVYPVPFMVPTYNNLRSNRYMLFLGMVLYDLLSLDKAFTRDKSKKLPLHKTIGRKKTLSLESCLKKKGLTGSSIYYDCQNINPERLTLAVLKSAMEQGAVAANYAKVNAFIRDKGNIKGVEVTDRLTGKDHDFTADITVNCAGPWADLVLNNAADKENEHHIRRSEGIHIITKKMCNSHAVTMMTANKRHIMMIPWRGHSLIGTTDKEYVGNPDNYRLTRESIEELIVDANESYGSQKLSYEDVIFAYGGLRPLVDDQTEGSYDSSRKYEIYDNATEGMNGLLTIEGGKYTTSRKLACQAMKVIDKKLGLKTGKSLTKKQYLSDSAIEDMEAFVKEMQLKYKDLPETTVDYISRNYGLKAHNILSRAQQNPELAKPLSHDGEIMACIDFVIEEEMALSLTDVLFRRTGIGTLGFPGQEIIDAVAGRVQLKLNWDAAKLKEEKEKAMKVFTLPGKDGSEEVKSDPNIKWTNSQGFA